MKIAVFTETYKPQKNGVVVFLSDFLPVISQNHEVVLFAPGGKKMRVEKVSKNFKIYWIKADDFPFYEGYKVCRISGHEIKKLLEKEKPDVIHMHAPVLMGLKALYESKKLKIPMVATYHTHFPDYVPHLFKGMLQEPLTKFTKEPVKKMISYCFSQVDITTAPTEELRKELESYGISNVIHVPNGVLFKKFGKPDTKKFMEKYNIPPNKPIVLYVGRISFEKKVDCLLRAFKKIPDAILVIVGTGPSFEKYRELADELKLKNVIFTGFVKDEMLPSAYASSDVFVSASDSETFGLTFVEAMNFGIPVIGVNRLGAKEVIQDGKNGFLVPPDDEGALAAGILKLLKNQKLRKKLGAQGKKDAKKYDMNEVSKEFVAIYKKLTKKKTKP